MSKGDYSIQNAANDYRIGRYKPVGVAPQYCAEDIDAAFIAGVEWARAQWPITPRTAEEAKPSDFGDALGLMWRDLGKKLDELSIWCGALEGQANRIDREQRAMIVDVGQKVEAVISLVDDLDELIRSEGGEAIEVAREDEEDEAYRPAVGMFGIGGDASVVSMVPREPVKDRPGLVHVGVDPASPDDDATVASVRDAEGRTHPLMPPRWAGAILDVFIHNNQLYVRCERAVFVHFGGQHLIPMQFGA